MGSDGPYGVYHSAFDNYNWFIKFADPTFVYEQQQARVFGLEILHMADADVLPYDYRVYGREVVGYVAAAQARASAAKLQVDFSAAQAAAQRLSAAGASIYRVQLSPAKSTNLVRLNQALRDAESALLNQQGLPRRSWYKHTIYAPGEYTGYAAVVIPGVNEGNRRERQRPHPGATGRAQRSPQSLRRYPGVCLGRIRVALSGVLQWRARAPAPWSLEQRRSSKLQSSSNPSAFTALGPSQSTELARSIRRSTNSFYSTVPREESQA